ncbi:MAG: NAD(P)-binding domain-containing protein [Candidatus Acidiferrales bacterium]
MEALLEQAALRRILPFSSCVVGGSDELVCPQQETSGGQVRSRIPFALDLFDGLGRGRMGWLFVRAGGEPAESGVARGKEITEKMIRRTAVSSDAKKQTLEKTDFLVPQHTELYWKVGLIGLGKLGTPVALAMSLKGHDVMGFDIDAQRKQKDHFPHQEKGPDGEPSIETLLRESALKFGTLKEVVHHAEIIFVAVQTPHEPLYEGVTRLPEERVDFDYATCAAPSRSCPRRFSKIARKRSWL